MNAGDARGDAAERQHRLANRDLALRKHRLDLAADHQANQLAFGDAGHLARADGLAVAQHGDAVGQRGSSSSRWEM